MSYGGHPTTRPKPMQLPNQHELRLQLRLKSFAYNDAFTRYTSFA